MLRAVDLGAQPRFLDGRRHDVRGQREIGGVELEAARLGLRGERFDGTPIRAKNIRHVRDRDLRREQVVIGRTGVQRRLQHTDRVLVAAGIEFALHDGKVRASLRRRVLQRLTQGGLRR